MKNLVYFLAIAGVIFGCSSDDETPPPPPPPDDFLVSINSGGPAYSFGGTDWEADRDNSASETFENIVAIEGTENDALYQTEVFDLAGFTYEIPVPGTGPWQVDLHFAEIFHGVENGNGVGSRVFDVDIEGGQAQLSNYDIIAAAGAPATAVVETFTDIDVQDGNLTISFVQQVDAAKISGVEVSGTF
jgi:hypothetical protein